MTAPEPNGPKSNIPNSGPSNSDAVDVETAERSGGPDNRWLYWTVGIVVVVLAVVGVVVYATERADDNAHAKAQTLTQKLAAAGIPAPSEEVLVRTFGTDGGAVCSNPTSALGTATLYSLLTNGAAFVGQRPVVIDGQILQGQALIMETYCPDRLAEFQDKVRKLKTADLIRNR